MHNYSKIFFKINAFRGDKNVKTRDINFICQINKKKIRLILIWEKPLKWFRLIDYWCVLIRIILQAIWKTFCDSLMKCRSCAGLTWFISFKTRLQNTPRKSFINPIYMTKRIYNIDSIHKGLVKYEC